MDELIKAINRLAESQEKANEAMNKSYELHRQAYEMNMKQYALNLENSEYNKDNNEKAEALKKQEMEQNEEALHIQRELINKTKSYVDESIQAVMAVVNGNANVTNKHFKEIITLIDAKADKADEKKQVNSILKTMIKNATFNKRP